MNIGKLSFSEIIAVGFERRNVWFAARWLFTLFVSLMAFGTLSALLASNGFFVLDTVTNVIGALVVFSIAIVLSLGTVALAKASITKAKKVDAIAVVKSLFWKTAGALIILGLGTAAVIGIAYGVGFLVKVPYVGETLMALLLVPAVVVFALAAVFFLVGTKLIFALLIDKPKLSALEAVKAFWNITKKAPEKLFFNFVLSVWPIGLTVLTAVLLVGFLALLPYLAFGWALPIYPLLEHASMLGFSGLVEYSFAFAINYLYGVHWFINLLVGLGFFAVLSYALGFVVSVSAAAYYSIYLDASKK